MAALDAAMMTKSFPVIPSRTSLYETMIVSYRDSLTVDDEAPYILIGNRLLTSRQSSVGIQLGSRLTYDQSDRVKVCAQIDGRNLICGDEVEEMVMVDGDGWDRA
jgi:hypothetical protein